MGWDVFVSATRSLGEFRVRAELRFLSLGKRLSSLPESFGKLSSLVYLGYSLVSLHMFAYFSPNSAPH